MYGHLGIRPRYSIVRMYCRLMMSGWNTAWARNPSARTNGRWSRTVPSFMSAQGFLTADWQGEDVEWPAWFQTPADTPVITNGLREQGFSSTEVEAIMGGNFLRLYEQVFP